MLISMHIENIAVIRRLDVDFDRGFTVLTGETGAGKSMIIDSIGLLLGAKTQRELIRTGESSATVSACFTVSNEIAAELAEIGIAPEEDGLLSIQRTITVDGKSQSRINGRVVPLSIQRQAGERLVSIHGQHDSHGLMTAAGHIDFLDSYAKDGALLAEYGEVYRKMCESRKLRDGCRMDERLKAQRMDMLRYQIEDIESASPEIGEEEALAAEKKILQNAKQLQKQVMTVYRALYKNEKGMSADKLLEIARTSLENISDLMPDAPAFIDRISEMQYELERIAESALAPLPSGGNSEARLEEIAERMDVLRRLKRKYGADEAEILDFYQKAKDELDQILLSDEKEREYDEQYKQYRAEALALADRLTEARKMASEDLSARICEELAYLDMNKVAFSARVTKKLSAEGKPELTPKGGDEVEFMISTNPGEPLKPLTKIASGGELSRVMLAIKCVLTAADKMPTVIFDEIDTGVSGKTSQKIGIKLRELAAEGPQVFSITHSAQVAANGHAHYKIRKQEVEGRAETTVYALGREERIEELARIMGGMDKSQKIIDSATEMLEIAESKGTIPNR